MTMYRLLEVKVYVTPDHVPTCAAHFPTGRVCRFLQTVRFGQGHVCALNGRYVERAEHPDDMGYLVPHNDCTVWATEPI